jgi:carboxylesterase type B
MDFLESAGSASVAFHLLSPGSRHLFWQAILQSAAATNTWAMVTANEGKLRAQRLAEVLKCPHTEVSCRFYDLFQETLQDFKMICRNNV